MNETKKSTKKILSEIYQYSILHGFWLNGHNVFVTVNHCNMMQEGTI